MVFVIYVLEVVDFSVMFACWDSIDPIRFGVCDVYVGCGGWFVAVVPWFASWSAILLPKIPLCALIFSNFYVVFGP